MLICLSYANVASRGRAQRPTLTFIKKQNKPHTVLSPPLPPSPAKPPACLSPPVPNLQSPCFE